MIQGRFERAVDKSAPEEGSTNESQKPTIPAEPPTRPKSCPVVCGEPLDVELADWVAFEQLMANEHFIYELLQRKLAAIEKFLAPEATPDDLNEREKRAQQVVATCAKYNKASWTVVDETKRPNTSLPAPEGVWGQVRFERPATKIREPNTDHSRGFGFIKVDEYDTYSMVLTLNRQGHKAIEIPLRDEEEKQLAFNAISQANQNTSAES